jgi:hypothetical protein
VCYRAQLGFPRPPCPQGLQEAAGGEDYQDCPTGTGAAEQPWQSNDPLYTTVLSFRESLVVFKRPFFWSLFIGNLVGISSGILVITQALQVTHECVCGFPPAGGRARWRTHAHGASLRGQTTAYARAPLLLCPHHQRRLVRV